MKLVKNEAESRLTVRGYKNIPPGNVHVVSDTIAENFKSDWGDQVTVVEYDPDGGSPLEQMPGNEGDDQDESESEYHQVLDNSVGDLEDELETGDYDAILEDLLEQEQDGKDRKTAVDAIKDRIKESGEETGDEDGEASGE